MITETRLQHMLGVARKVYQLAKEHGLSEEEARTCFTMGFLHDIGYEFTETNHTKVSYEIIKQTFQSEDSTKIINAIGDNGNPKLGNDNIYLHILNEANLTIDDKGNHVTVCQRLKNLANRFGKKSNIYKRALQTAERL